MQSKDNMIKGFPQEFQNFSGIASQLGLIVRYDLPGDEWESYVDRVSAVDGAAATAAAKKYIRPENLMIIIVGDRTSIEEGIRGLNLGEVLFVNAEDL